MSGYHICRGTHLKRKEVRSVSNVCKNCIFKKNCEAACPAYTELYMISDIQDKQDKTNYIRSLIKKLGIREAEKSESLRLLGNKIIKKFPEFSFIREWNIKIGYVISQESKRGEKTAYADCRKVPEVYRAYLPYDFIITFYDMNIGLLNENQQKLVMYHELRHIGMGERGLKIIPHNIEDFSSILTKFGMDWNVPGEEIPDILGGE